MCNMTTQAKGTEQEEGEMVRGGGGGGGSFNIAIFLSQSFFNRTYLPNRF